MLFLFTLFHIITSHYQNTCQVSKAALYNQQLAEKTRKKYCGRVSDNIDICVRYLYTM